MIYYHVMLLYGYIGFQHLVANNNAKQKHLGYKKGKANQK